MPKRSKMRNGPKMSEKMSRGWCQMVRTSLLTNEKMRMSACQMKWKNWLIIGLCLLDGRFLADQLHKNVIINRHVLAGRFHLDVLAVAPVEQLRQRKAGVWHHQLNPPVAQPRYLVGDDKRLAGQRRQLRLTENLAGVQVDDVAAHCPVPQPFRRFHH